MPLLTAYQAYLAGKQDFDLASELHAEMADPKARDKAVAATLTELYRDRVARGELDDPELLQWLAEAGRTMIPMMKDSAIAIALVSGGIDPKICLEIGAMVLLDKPIIAVVVRGAKVPANFKRVACCILEGDPSEPGMQARIQAAIADLLANDARAKKEAADA